MRQLRDNGRNADRRTENVMDRAERLQKYLALISRHREGGIEAIPPTSVEEVVAATDLPEVELAFDTGAATESIESDPVLAANVAAANSALDKARMGAPAADFSPHELDAAEAIVLFRERPALDVIRGEFQTVHEQWLDINSGPIHQRLVAAMPSVGRIGLPGQSAIPYAGTGFVVGDGLLMTNRHVAEIFARGLGRRIDFKSGGKADIDFLRERDRPDRQELEVRAVRMIHPYWDMALLEVEGLAGHDPLSLSLREVDALDGWRVAVIGYPAYDPLRNSVSQQNALFSGVYGVKRLQPGMIHGRVDAGSFGKVVSAGAHDCSTLGGNSGSALIDFETGKVLGLHFGGRFEEVNYFVPAFELARDGRVVDAGVRFAESPSGGTPPWSNYWPEESAPLNAAGTENGGAKASGDAAGAVRGGGKPPAAPGVSLGGAGSSVSVTIPLTITVSLGGSVLGAHVERADSGRESVAGGDDFTETLREPSHDTDYADRKGYDAGFLAGFSVPLPHAADPGRIAPLLDGSDTLHYGHFSIQTDRFRRLALFTASNVTGEKALRRPEPGRDYTRKGLSGLGENDMEKWFPDPRLSSDFQLSDRFYTKDGGAFDKGHIVRRDDVAWGATYDALRQANGDTYHVTNCSPQVAQFNQSARGTDNWGDLENSVLSQASSDRYCLFAGPVLDPANEVFIGKAADGSVQRLRIPRAFWKVVVAVLDDRLAAYAFVLEQDLSAVDLEFTVPDAFRRRMIPLGELERRTGIVFPDTVRQADRFELDGAEVAFRAGIAQADTFGRAEDPESSPNGGDDEAGADEAETPVFTPESEEAVSAFRIAKALDRLRSTVNQLAPARSKASDGWIGDAAHQSRASDHNPWVRDGATGVVTALDITHDPAGGCDAGKLAESLRTAKDPRVKYVIFDRRIANREPIGAAAAWAWRPYNGKNPHNHHVHISVRPDKPFYDAADAWAIKV